MTKFIPPGFNESNVYAGLYKAMGFGEPNQDADKVAFFIEKDSDLPSTTPQDQTGVPFNPAKKRPKTHRREVVMCAVEYQDRGETTEQFGAIQPTRVKLTLLDADYQKIKGFRYVVAGGDQYWHAKTEPPLALGPIDVWIIHCSAQDES